jgi:hypothetical protein
MDSVRINVCGTWFSIIGRFGIPRAWERGTIGGLPLRLVQKNRRDAYYEATLSGSDYDRISAAAAEADARLSAAGFDEDAPWGFDLAGALGECPSRFRAPEYEAPRDVDGPIAGYAPDGELAAVMFKGRVPVQQFETCGFHSPRAFGKSPRVWVAAEEIVWADGVHDEWVFASNGYDRAQCVVTKSRVGFGAQVEVLGRDKREKWRISRHELPAFEGYMRNPEDKRVSEWNGFPKRSIVVRGN